MIHTPGGGGERARQGGGELARRYHGPRYRAILADLALALAVLAVLAFTRPGRPCSARRPAAGGAGAFVLGVLIVTVSAVVRLPLSIWLGLLHERASASRAERA